MAYRELCVAVHLEPVGADEVLLVKHGVIRAEEVEILELKKKKIVSKILIQNYVRSIKINLSWLKMRERERMERRHEDREKIVELE